MKKQPRMTIRFPNIIRFIVLCLIAMPLAAQQVPQDLRKAIQERDQAIDNADPAAWDRLTADEFTVVNESGTLMTKAQRLAQLRTQKPTTPGVVQKEEIKLYGEVAIRRLLSGELWVLDVWVRQGSGWRATMVQVTPSKK